MANPGSSNGCAVENDYEILSDSMGWNGKIWAPSFLVITNTVLLPATPQSAKPDQTGLEWSAMHIEHRGFCDAPVAPVHFVFTNKRSTPVVLNVTSTSCECTTATVSPTVVQPGKQGTVVVEISINDRRGRIENWIKLSEQGTNLHAARLTMTHHLEPTIEAIPNVVFWRLDEREVWKSVSLKIARDWPDSIATVECADERIDVRIPPATNESEEVVQMRPARLASRGHFTIHVKMESGHVVPIMGGVR